jgi:hypothetical protein
MGHMLGWVHSDNDGVPWNMHGQGGEEADRPGRCSVCSLSTLSFTHARALAGRFSSAARRLADLRKALDAAAGQGGGKACQLDPDHQTLAEACAGCARDLEEVCACCCKYPCATPQEAVCCVLCARGLTQDTLPASDPLLHV